MDIKSPSFPLHRIIGSLPVFTKRAQDNRQNPKVYEVFSNILGEKVSTCTCTIATMHWLVMQELMVNQDRYGLFRPTIEDDGTIHDEWKTVRNVHLDVRNHYLYGIVHETCCLQHYIVLYICKQPLIP